MKLVGKCYNCKKNKLFVSRRKVYLPVIKMTALSQVEICSGCQRKLQAELDTQKYVDK